MNYKWTSAVLKRVLNGVPLCVLDTAYYKYALDTGSSIGTREIKNSSRTDRKLVPTVMCDFEGLCLKQWMKLLIWDSTFL